MHFSFGPEEETLRREVQEFIRTNVLPDLLDELKEEKDSGKRGPLANAFYDKVFARGWFGASWPEEHGGMGMGPMAAFVVAHEDRGGARATLPMRISVAR
jgi:alkylation response protein AidB-like acyl-CoA dehydrogenase